MKAEDYFAVRRYGRPFQDMKRSKAYFNTDVLNILVSCVEASLMLGLLPEATSNLRQAEKLYGTPSQLSLAAAAIHRLHGDFAAAEAAIDIAFCAAPAKRSAKAGDLVAAKAEFLLARGQTQKARNLIAANLADIYTPEMFELLAQSVTEPDQIIDFEDILLPRLSFFGPQFRHALHHYALLLLRMDKPERAIAIARECFMTVIRSLSFGSQSEVIAPAGDHRAEAALSDLLHELRHSGSRLFLAGRTLLRNARSESVGNRIDVGIDENTSSQIVRDALSRSLRFSILPTENDNFVSLRHINGSRVDIFRHHSHAGKIIRENNDVYWWNTPFEYAKVVFLNHEIDAPANLDQYLTESYGDWRRKKDDFDDLIDTRNLVVTRAEHVIVQCLLRLPEYYLAGKRAGLNRVRDRLVSIYSYDEFLLTTLQSIARNPEPFRNISENALEKPLATKKPAARAISKSRASLRTRNAVKSEPLQGLKPLSGAERARAPSPVIALIRRFFRMPQSSRAAMLEARRLKELFDRQPANASLKIQFEKAAVRAGRDNIHAENYEDACRVFYSLRGISQDTHLAERNLSSAALKGARRAEAEGNKRKALTFWRYLQEAEPDSRVASQGIARCS
jgi:hypothetical protein